MIEWESGEISAEPLVVVAKDDPVAVAIYAKDNDLLDTPGWNDLRALPDDTRSIYVLSTSQASVLSPFSEVHVRIRDSKDLRGGHSDGQGERKHEVGGTGRA